MKKATALLCCLITGGIHLFIYCLTSKIPIPLDIMTTSSIILIFGVSTIFTTLTIALAPCILLPFCSIFQESKIYCEILKIKNRNTTPEKRGMYILLQAIKNYLILFSPTVITFIILIYHDNSSKDIFGAKLFFTIMLIEILSSSLFFQMFILSKTTLKNHIENLTQPNIYTIRALTFLCILGVKFIWLLSMAFCALWAVKIFKVEDNFAIGLLLFSTAIANFIFLIAGGRPNFFQRTAQKYDEKNFSVQSLKGTYDLSIYIVIFIAALLLLHPSFVKETSAATLKILKVGGGVELVYYFNKINIGDIPREIIDICDTDTTCKTKQLSVLIDIGKTLYVKDGENFIYSLPREKLQLIINN